MWDLSHDKNICANNVNLVGALGHTISAGPPEGLETEQLGLTTQTLHAYMTDS